MILAPQLMAQEKDPKKAAAHCFNSIELDPENYRIGHTKASEYMLCLSVSILTRRICLWMYPGTLLPHTMFPFFCIFDCEHLVN